MEEFNKYNEVIEKQNEAIWSWSSHENELEQQKHTKDILQSRDEQRAKAEILSNWLDYGITEYDFDVKKVDDMIIIISKSSYFSSIVGLNWEQERFNSRNLKDRIEYDKFDEEISRLFKSGITKEQFKDELSKYCKGNNINFNPEIMTLWWGCVIPEWNFIWIKKFPWDSSEIAEKDKLTIAHENQHVKFNKYCEENWIEKNWYLKILDEVIAHCLNTKDEDWNIDFDKIEKSMINNENYRKNSWFTKDYGWVLVEIIQDVKNNIKDNLNETMRILVNKYKN